MTDASSTRPVRLAVVSNSLPPYRLFTHRRVLRANPGLELFTVLTHEEADQPWTLTDVADIRPVQFGRGHSVLDAYRPKFALREWAKGGRICRWLTETKIDAVIVSGYSDPGRLRIFRFCARRGTPVFLSADSNIHGDTARGLKRRVKGAIIGAVRGWTLRSGGGVMPMGENGRKHFGNWGWPEGRMFWFPLVPDFEGIRGLSPDFIARTCAARGIDPRDGRRRLVFCGRLVGLKRVDLLIDAFAAIAAQRPDWDLVIIGDGPLRSELMARVPETLAGRVKWLGFMGVQDEISAVYRASDVLALTSNYDAWGLVVFEAATAGCALICSHVVGAGPEMLRDGVNGAVFQSEDLGSLTEAVRRVTDPARIDGYKAASRGIVDGWIAQKDPGLGVRAALTAAGVMR